MGSPSSLNSETKVKLLCAFGGKFVHMQSSGMLRYVDGEYRMIAVKRDVTFDELGQKLVDIYGREMEIRYQISGEDLSVRILVESDDDLQNMMYEYDKLVRSTADGSPHLWVFLSVAPPRKASKVLDEIHQSTTSNPAPKSSFNTFPVGDCQNLAAVLRGKYVGRCYLCLLGIKDDDKIRSSSCRRHKSHLSCYDFWRKHDWKHFGGCFLCRLAHLERLEQELSKGVIRMFKPKPLWQYYLCWYI